MNNFSSTIVEPIGWAIINSFWQMALLWLIYQVAETFSIFRNQRLKANVAIGLLLTGVCWFVATAITYQNTKSILLNFNFTFISKYSFINLVKILLTLIAASYFIFIIKHIGQFKRNYQYVKIISKQGLSKIDVEWRIYVKKMQAILGIKKSVNIWLSELVNSPVTIGFFKPAILIPLATINQLTTSQIEAVLLHELAHIRRFDYLLNMLIAIIQTILYFNPFVNRFVNVIEKEREHSCDNLVIQFQYNRLEYANALLSLEQARQKQPIFLIAAGGQSQSLLPRIEKILGNEGRKKITLKTFFSSLLLLLFIWCGHQFLNRLPVNPTSVSDKLVSSTWKPLPDVPLLETNESFSVVKNIPIEFSNKEYVRKGLNVEKKTSSPIKAPTTTLINEELTNDISLTTTPKIKLTQVSEIEVLKPSMNDSQEKSVEEALDASRTILEDLQWKKIEMNVAETMTADEKIILKKRLLEKIDQLNWGHWKQQIERSYFTTDWETLTYELKNAVNAIKIDSVQNQFNKTIVELTNLRNVLIANGMIGVPDTDISIAELDKKILLMKNVVEQLRHLRNKKVVQF